MIRVDPRLHLPSHRNKRPCEPNYLHQIQYSLEEEPNGVPFPFPVRMERVAVPVKSSRVVVRFVHSKMFEDPASCVSSC
jgi:hypothetical protein